MANTKVAYLELRFVITDQNLTEAYVLVKNLSGDGMPGVEGWHHKTFPGSMSVLEIVQTFAHYAGSPLFWPLEAPGLPCQYPECPNNKNCSGLTNGGCQGPR